MTQHTDHSPLTQFRISRRGLLTGGSSLIAAAALPFGGGRVFAATTAHTVKAGAAEITVLSDGIFTMPVGIVLPDAPKDRLVELVGAVDGGFKAETNVCVVRIGASLVLVDSGAGGDFMPTLGALADRMEAAGIAPDAITHVVFTHAHPDHFWGVIDPFEGDTRFASAKHLMTAAERDFWLKPGIEASLPDMVKGMAVGIAKRLGTLAERIEPVAPGAEVVPGVAIVATPGHTPGHVAVQVGSGGDQVMIVGDALTHAVVSFAEPGWRWGSDLDQDLAIKTRRALLDRLVADKVQLIGYHFPTPGAGRVEAAGNAYRFVAV